MSRDIWQSHYPLGSQDTQVGFNFTSVQVCLSNVHFRLNKTSPVTFSIPKMIYLNLKQLIFIGCCRVPLVLCSFPLGPAREWPVKARHHRNLQVKKDCSLNLKQARIFGFNGLLPHSPKVESRQRA